MLDYELYKEKVDKKKVSNLYKEKVDLKLVKEYVYIGMSDAAISRLIDVHPNTLYNWKIQGAPFLEREYNLIKSGKVSFKELRPLGYNSGYTPLYEVLTMGKVGLEELELCLWDVHRAAHSGYKTKESKFIDGDYELRDIEYGRDPKLELDVLKSIMSYKEKRQRYELDRELKLAKLDLDIRAQELAELRYKNRLSDKEYENELKKALYDKQAEIRKELIESGEYDGIEHLATLIEELDFISSEGDE